MRRLLLALPLLALLALALRTARAPLRAQAPAPTRTATATPTLAAVVSSDRPVYQPGERVTFTLAITNAGGAPVTLPATCAGTPAHEFVVTKDGAPIWRGPPAPPCPSGTAGTVTLAPGETQRLTAVWDQQVTLADAPPRLIETGIYTVEGRLLAARAPAAMATPFAVGLVSPVPAPAAQLSPPAGVNMPPASHVVFSRSRPLIEGGTPVRGGGTFLEVVNGSERSAIALFDGNALVIAAPEELAVRVLDVQSMPAGECLATDGGAGVVRCGVTGFGTPARVTFTFDPADEGERNGEAALYLADPRPCIPAGGTDTCDAERAALWGGDPAAWAARGVTDPDARFNETVVFRVRAGDPVAIRGLAVFLGTPYLKITRLRFAGTPPDQGDEFVQITNLGSRPQELTGWSLRSPSYVVQTPAGERMAQQVPLRAAFTPGVVLGPGQSCRVYARVVRPDSCGTTTMPSTVSADSWSDIAGTAVLYVDALDLLGDQVQYDADPNHQPPPPNLQLVTSLRAPSGPPLTRPTPTLTPTPAPTQMGTLPIPGETRLAPGVSATFMSQPPPPATPLAGGPPFRPPVRSNTVSVANRSDQPATVAYDGGGLTITAAEGSMLQVASANRSGFSGCVAVNGQANVLHCRAVASALGRVSVRTAVPAPAGTLTLPYRDGDGTGELTITNGGGDVAPGGARVTVAITRGATDLRGSGVLRPEPQPDNYLLAAPVADAAGISYLVQGTLRAGAAWTARGQWITDAEPIRTGVWSAGVQPPEDLPVSRVAINLQAPPVLGAPGTPGPRLPSLPLPALMGEALLDPLGPPGSGRPVLVAPPAIGRAGEPVDLIAITALPFGVPATPRPTYAWRFGDGDGAAPSTEQTATHTYRAAGEYTILAISTDSTGVRTFGLTRIRID